MEFKSELKLTEPNYRIRVNEVSLRLAEGIRDRRRVLSVNLQENLRKACISVNILFVKSRGRHACQFLGVNCSHFRPKISNNPHSTRKKQCKGQKLTLNTPPVIRIQAIRERRPVINGCWTESSGLIAQLHTQEETNALATAGGPQA